MDTKDQAGRRVAVVGGSDALAALVARMLRAQALGLIGNDVRCKAVSDCVIEMVRDHDKPLMELFAEQTDEATAANKFLDGAGVPRGDSAGPFSLSGRIRHFPAALDQARAQRGMAELRAADAGYSVEAMRDLRSDPVFLDKMREAAQAHGDYDKSSVRGSGVDHQAGKALHELAEAERAAVKLRANANDRAAEAVYPMAHDAMFDGAGLMAEAMAGAEDGSAFTRESPSVQAEEALHALPVWTFYVGDVIYEFHASEAADAMAQANALIGLDGGFQGLGRWDLSEVVGPRVYVWCSDEQAKTQANAAKPARSTALHLVQERGATLAELRLACLKHAIDVAPIGASDKTVKQIATVFSAFVIGEN